MSKPNEYRSSRTVEHMVDYDAWFTSEVGKDWQRLTEANLPTLGSFAR